MPDDSLPKIRRSKFNPGDPVESQGSHTALKHNSLDDDKAGVGEDERELGVVIQRQLLSVERSLTPHNTAVTRNDHTSIQKFCCRVADLL